MSDDLIQEQIEYYRARAQEYEATALPDGIPDADTQNPYAQEWLKAMRVVKHSRNLIAFWNWHAAQGFGRANRSITPRI